MVRRIDWRGHNGKQVSTRSAPVPTPYAIVDFPGNPNIGDQFLAPNGSTYQWDGTVWVGVYLDASDTAIVPIDINPPLNPVQGQLWWRNDPDANLFIFYFDGNSSQWVPAAQPNPNTSGQTGIEEAPNDGQIYARSNGAWVVITP
jgi:hypothetical protein